MTDESPSRPGAAALSRVARRTRLVRAALAVALVALVLLASCGRAAPGASGSRARCPCAPGDMIVLDLSASISSDTFSRIGETLRKLVATGGRYGLVVFSNVAYEALPPGYAGLGASAAGPVLHGAEQHGARVGQPALPTNPWTLSFSSGTRISAGLDLAHRILVDERSLARPGSC